MKHAAAVAALVLFALACSSSQPDGTPRVAVTKPEMIFVQLVGPADLNYPTGSIEVQYGMRISNRWSEPITLRKIELTSMGAGGPYVLKGETYFFQQKIAPAEYSDVTWWAEAYASGNAFALDATAPVSVRAVAYFETSQGAMRKAIVRNFTQNGAGASRGR
ncbi:MAG TPA: hypothetical protein VHL59_14435 [Thermoanaerobaculia bacterium]|nr:hypothetical protein [Thermoanaerobaculia bacterium]